MAGFPHHFSFLTSVTVLAVASIEPSLNGPAVVSGRSFHPSLKMAGSLFVEAGLLDRPAVLLLVDPPHRHVEVVTGPEARERIPDEEAATAVTAMTAAFAAGNLATGLIAGIQHLADVAGPGEPPPDATDLANVIGGR